MYDERHGGPFDRGSADYWYRRPFEPHYYKGDTYASERVDSNGMTDEELDAYPAGWEQAERFGGQKDYGDDED